MEGQWTAPQSVDFDAASFLKGPRLLFILPQ